jgi:uncharacterized protein YecT (DUF1311 family)
MLNKLLMSKKRTGNITALKAIAFGLILASTGIATPDNTTAQPLNCKNPSSNVEYKECARLAYEQADKRLNQVYRQLTARLSKAERKELTDAQLAWIRFRDTNCSFAVYPSRGGTGYGGFLSECLERLTRQRTTQLEEYLRDRER